MLRRVWAATVVVAVLAGLTAPLAAGKRPKTYSTRGTRPLRTALLDPFIFTKGSEQPTAFAMAQSAGARYIRFLVRWYTVAPTTRPADFVATDPTSPGYTWSYLDTTVQAAKSAGLQPILDVVDAPAWAANAQGTPRAKDLGEFAKALATHFDGKHGVPAVHAFQVWNEPNNSLDLSPVKPAVYRDMVNAFAKPVHAVNHANLVVAGGLDPFKNKAKRFHTMAPLAFMERFLCISMGNPKAKKAKLRRPHRTCKARALFDVWSHHPYTFNGPFGHAHGPDDVSLGDLPKMKKVLRTAVKLHQVVSAHRNKVQFWVTEFAWDTNPPRRHAAPIHLQARWTSEALYQMWRSGVSLVTWFLLQDHPKPSIFQSGLYFHSKKLERARAKPTRQAFRFPFVAYRDTRAVTVWGRDATSDKRLVTVQLRHGRRGRWRTVARIRSNRNGIFKAKLALVSTPKDWLRAVAPQSGKSLAFSLNPPSPKLRYGPWGN